MKTQWAFRSFEILKIKKPQSRNGLGLWAQNSNQAGSRHSNGKIRGFFLYQALSNNEHFVKRVIGNFEAISSGEINISRLDFLGKSTSIINKSICCYFNFVDAALIGIQIFENKSCLNWAIDSVTETRRRKTRQSALKKTRLSFSTGVRLCP